MNTIFLTINQLALLICTASKYEENDFRTFSVPYKEVYNDISNFIHSIRPLSKTILTTKSVRQDFILFPLIFKMYINDVIRNCLKNATSGIRINRNTLFNNLLYADDQIIVQNVTIYSPTKLGF